MMMNNDYPMIVTYLDESNNIIKAYSHLHKAYDQVYTRFENYIEFVDSEDYDYVVYGRIHTIAPVKYAVAIFENRKEDRDADGNMPKYCVLGYTPYDAELVTKYTDNYNEEEIRKYAEDLDMDLTDALWLDIAGWNVMVVVVYNYNKDTGNLLMSEDVIGKCNEQEEEKEEAMQEIDRIYLSCEEGKVWSKVWCYKNDLPEENRIGLKKISIHKGYTSPPGDLYVATCYSDNKEFSGLQLLYTKASDPDALKIVWCTWDFIFAFEFHDFMAIFEQTASLLWGYPWRLEHPDGFRIHNRLYECRHALSNFFRVYACDRKINEWYTCDSYNGFKSDVIINTPPRYVWKYFHADGCNDETLYYYGPLEHSWFKIFIDEYGTDIFELYHTMRINGPFSDDGNDPRWMETYDTITRICPDICADISRCVDAHDSEMHSELVEALNTMTVLRCESGKNKYNKVMKHFNNFMDFLGDVYDIPEKYRIIKEDK